MSHSWWRVLFGGDYDPEEMSHPGDIEETSHPGFFWWQASHPGSFWWQTSHPGDIEETSHSGSFWWLPYPRVPFGGYRISGWHRGIVIRVAIGGGSYPGFFWWRPYLRVTYRKCHIRVTFRNGHIRVPEKKQPRLEKKTSAADDESLLSQRRRGPWHSPIVQEERFH
jgi:hypothetical protein